MQSNIIKRIKLIVTVLLIAAFVWFLIISPMITFHNNEKKLEDAARRYYELNPTQLPTGERVKTVTLEELYHKSFIKGDIFVPYTTKTCSVTNSWVKVRRENGEFKYYTYLECGVLSSTVDHKGPDITLNGNKSVTIGKGEKYKDAGVKSVVDNTDGKMKLEDVTIKNEVDTSKIGTYKVTYTAYDSLKNKAEVVREVKVVQKLNSTIKTSLGDNKNFTGNPENNYVRLSNMLFRVYGLDNNKNVVIVSDSDIANVNYSKLDKWLDYYYNNLNDFAKNVIVDSKYCNMKVSETTLDTTQCASYTKNRKVYIPSIIEVNNAKAGGLNFMRPSTMSWVANAKDSKSAYLTRNVFYYDKADKTYLAYNVNENYGVRPMMTIKGDTLITNGDGTVSNPYTFGDVKKAKAGSHVNTRFTGEYVLVDDMIYRIIKVENDGTTKVISNNTLTSNAKNVVTSTGSSNNKITYNPKDKNSVAYFIANDATAYINTGKFVKHEVEVPIYKGNIIYGEEIKNEKYNVVLSAPDMYEMFSARARGSDGYWLKNTSKKDWIVGAIYPAGVPINEELDGTTELGIRVVAYLSKNTTISEGEGTLNQPYIIK